MNDASLGGCARGRRRSRRRWRARSRRQPALQRILRLRLLVEQLVEEGPSMCSRTKGRPDSVLPDSGGARCSSGRGQRGSSPRDRAAHRRTRWRRSASSTPAESPPSAPAAPAPPCRSRQSAPRPDRLGGFDTGRRKIRPRFANSGPAGHGRRQWQAHELEHRRATSQMRPPAQIFRAVPLSST